MLGILKKVSLNFFVYLDVNKTKHQSLCAAFEFFADLENSCGKFSRRELFGKQHRIKTPDDSFRSDQGSELLEGLNSAF